MSTNDIEFRRRVEQDARRAGWTAADASLLAKHVGKRPPAIANVTAPTHRASTARAHHTGGTQQSERNERLDALGRIYSAPPDLIAEWKKLPGALRVFADALGLANGHGKVNTPAAVERARLIVATRTRELWGAA